MDTKTLRRTLKQEQAALDVLRERFAGDNPNHIFQVGDGFGLFVFTTNNTLTAGSFSRAGCR